MINGRKSLFVVQIPGAGALFAAGVSGNTVASCQSNWSSGGGTFAQQQGRLSKLHDSAFPKQ